MTKFISEIALAGKYLTLFISDSLFLVNSLICLNCRHKLFTYQCRLLITFAYNLEPDKARQNVRHDQDPNYSILYCYSRNIFFRKTTTTNKLILKKNITRRQNDDKKSQWIEMEGATCTQGGYSIFFCIRRLGPSIYRSPPKYQEFQAPQKNIWNFSNPKKYPNSVPWPLKNTLKPAQFCDDPQKYPQNHHTPKKYSFFWKPPRNIEIQNFEPPKIARAYVCVKYQSTPLGHVHACLKLKPYICLLSIWHGLGPI